MFFKSNKDQIYILVDCDVHELKNIKTFFLYIFNNNINNKIN